MAFEPKEHLMKIGKGESAKDYLAVQWRIVWFRKECAEGTIETELISLDLDREISKEEGVWNNTTRKFEKVLKSAKGYALFKATVKDGKGGCAVAHGSESAVDFGDFIEKSETKAVGRALAMLGYGTQFTGQEFDEGARIVDAPVSPSQIDHLKSQWAEAYNIPDAQVEARWPKYLVHLFNAPLAEPDIKQDHIKKITNAIEEQKKLAKAS